MGLELPIGRQASAEAPARADRQDAAAWWQRLTPGPARVRTRDVALLVQHLATLLDAGLPLSKSLRTVARQLEHPVLSALVSELSDEVAAGEMLSAAMARRPQLFDSLTINVVRAGEAGGTLPETLGQLAEDLEKKEALRRTVRGAVAYPLVVLSVATVVVAFLLVYVVPTFEDVYTKMHLQLPLVTRLLLALSRGAVRLWWLPLLVGLGVAAGWPRLRAMAGFRRWWDSAMLRLPLLGKLRRQAIASRFLGAFATLVGSGVSIVESLRLMGGLVDNLVVQEAVADIRHHVSQGGTLGKPMERYAELFSPMAIQMISVGEETGSLPEAAARTAAFLAADVHSRVNTVTTLMEPLLTVVLGVVVGLIALAIYLPMFDLMKHVAR
ncbi:MAG: type II secretion system F family protein [Candidatus Brocadiia bacterium]